MKALKVLPGSSPKLVDIGSDLDSLQNEVGGYIQALYPFEDQVAIVCNEEGKLTGLRPNRILQDEDGSVYDIICGPFLIVGLGEEDFADLPCDLIDKYISKYEIPEYFVRTGYVITVLRGSERFVIS